MQISKERLEALSKMKSTKVQIIDVVNEAGAALGTKIILRMPLKYKSE